MAMVRITYVPLEMTDGGNLSAGFQHAVCSAVCSHAVTPHTVTIDYLHSSCSKATNSSTSRVMQNEKANVYHTLLRKVL